MLKIFDEIRQIQNIEIRENYDLSNIMTMRIRAQGHFIVVRSVEALSILIKKLNQKRILYRLVGLGANQVLKSSKEIIYLRLKFQEVDSLNEFKNIYKVSASTPLNKLTSLAKKFNLDGWQCLTGIPASLGGAICMNAGTRIGEIKDILVDVTILRKEGNIENIKIEDKHFSYRKNHFLNNGDIILEARLKHFGSRLGVKEEISDYLEKRKADQPWGTNNCGCVFKNTENISAGMAIDLLKLKGKKYKGMKISDIHANFIENTDGDYESFVEFVKYIQYQLKLFCGEKFELEVKID